MFVTLTRKTAVPHGRALTILATCPPGRCFSIDFGSVREAAARMGAERLLSEDMNHGQMIAGVRIVNRFKQFAAQSW